METFLSFLFPRRSYDFAASWILLFIRITFGVLLMRHGINKWMLYDEWAPVFPDPFQFGARFSLMLTASTECVCGFTYIIGFLHRVCVIPLIIVMLVAFFIICVDEPFYIRELPFIYLCIFVITYVSGPGRYSVDHYIFHWIQR